MRRRLWSAASALVLFAFYLLAAPAPASAHAFLIQSSPAAGQRLRLAPRTLSLTFTEPVVRGSIHLLVKAASGSLVRTGAVFLAGGRSTVSASFPALRPGVYLVDWQVVSAEDGHYSSGEFAFAIGSGIPLRSLHAETGQPTDWPNAVAGWLLLLGSALALGGFANERLIGRRIGATPGAFARRSFLLIALGVALTGSTLSLLLFVASLGAGSPLVTLLRLHTWAQALVVPAGVWNLTSFVLVLYALLVSWRRQGGGSVLAALVLTALAVAMRSHPAATGAWWASIAVAVHVIVAQLWVGMLLNLVLVLWRKDTYLSHADVSGAIAQYARFALFSVAAVLASGIVAAFAVFTSIGQLVTTTYGRVLLGKAALVIVALLLALRSRISVSRSKDASSILRSRPAMQWEASLLALVLGVAVLLGNVAPPPPAIAAAANSPGSLLGPPAPSGPALTLAGQAGWLEVFLTASRGRLTLQVVSPESERPGGVRLPSPDSPTGNAVFAEPPSGRHGSIGLSLRSCGAGCFTVPFRWRPGVTRLHLEVTAKGWAGGGLSFAVPWPPQPASPSDWTEVLSTLSHEPQFTMHELVVSGPHESTSTIYHMTGRELMQSEPYPKTATDVYLLRQEKGSSEFVAYFPGSLIWMHFWVDAEHRITRQVTVDQGHLIVDRITYGEGAR